MVVTISLKVTATVDAGVQAVEVEVLVEEDVVPVPVVVADVVVVVTPDTGVWFAGHEPVDAVE